MLTIPDLPIDSIVNGRYRLKRRIGSGSVSSVYLAADQRDGTDHAIRIISPEMIGNDPTVAESFLLLARDAFALCHPNIVSVTDSGLVNNLPFMTLDLVEGSSLKDTLAIRGPLPPAHALEYLTAIGAGLASAHAHGVVHGDLKPRNILIQKDLPLAHAIKISDFGLSGLKSGKIESTAQEKSGILRSPLYLAPEEFSEEKSDVRSDIYSLGVILYQMLAGDVPFKGKSIPAIMKAHLMQSPPRIAGRVPEISEEVESVVMHALEKDPANRPATVENFVEEFRQAVRGDAAVDLNRTIVLASAYVEAPTEEEMVIEADEPHELAPSLSAATQSVLLALGVVLVLALIGFGIYYSRTSQ
ncbi:MAG TPA: serine/threonine-protein kinase [Pyrinomonadaceae bacterium]|nr:serine/threonine-protein kinase [Pyrinomonadaceae bacterium]